MTHKWYRAKLTKGILIVLEHVLAVILALCLVWMVSYPMVWREASGGQAPEKYEDTSQFYENLSSMSDEVIQGIGKRGLFETDGMYDPDRIVDIEQYSEDGSVTNENVSGLAYYLEDLLAWGDDWNQNGEESNYDTGIHFAENIVVCKKPDGTYHYYYYDEFQVLIDEGTLQFVIPENGQEFSQESVLKNLQEGNYVYDEDEGYDSGSVYDDYSNGDNGNVSDFKGLQDEAGKIAYIDCWNYDGIRVAEQYQPLGADSILELVNDSPDWNGRLNDAYSMLRNDIYKLNNDKQIYDELGELYQEGGTNFFYLYVDQDTKQVFTNRKAFENYEDVEKSLDTIQNMGKYLIVEPDETTDTIDFETNMKQSGLDNGLDNMSSYGGKETNYLYAAGVDTRYPVKDGFSQAAQIYEKHISGVGRIMVTGISAAVLFVGILVWLTAVAGRGGRDAQLHLNWFDRWKTELAAAVVIALWMIPIVLAAPNIFIDASSEAYTIYDEYGNLLAQSRVWVNGLGISVPGMVLGAVLALYTCMMFLIGYLSLVRRIKGGTLWKNSIIRSICCFIADVFRNLHTVWKVILLFGAFVVVHWVAILVYNHGWELAVVLAAELIAFVYLIRNAIGRERINRGLIKIAGGEVDYQIPLEGLSVEQKNVAERINTIGEGLDAAVEKSMKSERLKTDLITNVSHDIKTPLTSIINYVELLKQENFEDPKIQRYLEVLEEKSQRLKTLTEDVVEASKVSSGNITLEYMDINLVELIQQTSGEFEEKFTARDLREILSLPDQEIMIRADGRRMWRVLANIYNNAAKYAMKGTRVYADLYMAGDKAVFSLKNISEQPLNISAEELMERFVRGDLSRSTEGSGLGLSIAKTLTEMQGGRFELYLDGDLFRVTITFPVGYRAKDD